MLGLCFRAVLRDQLWFCASALLGLTACTPAMLSALIMPKVTR